MKYLFIFVITIGIITLSLDYTLPHIYAQGQEGIINHALDKIVHVNITVQSNSGNIKYIAFDPSQIKIKVGTTVVWTNNDTVVRTVTNHPSSIDAVGNVLKSLINPQLPPFHPQFDSDFLVLGEKFQYTFNTPGQYEYYDKEMPNLMGTIFVVH